MYDRSADTRDNLIKKIRNIKDFKISSKDKEILRKIAGEIAELAARPEQEEKRKLWYKHNNLEETRPLILCDPENGWYEIIVKDNLECEGEFAREWEWILRRELFWGEAMGDDRPLEPYFNIPYIYTESDWGLQISKIGGEKGGAYHIEAPLKNYNDFDKLKFSNFEVDYKLTEKIINLTEEIFGDILIVQPKTTWWWSMGLTDTLGDIRGLEQIMYDMYDYPDELHRLMAFLRDGHMARLDYLEKNHLLTLNNDGTYVASGGLGYTHQLPKNDFDGKHVRTMDMWGFAESQVTSEISLDMFKEFIFPYQLPLLERFGLNCYGCCEAIDRRWDVVKQIPRLKRVSVSNWADMRVMADHLKDQYIYSWKPSPSHLAASNMDEDLVRKVLREGIRNSKNCRVEIIMKDNHTIGNNPQNVIRWCQIAKEEAENI